MSNLSRVINLLADYATGKPLLSHLTPADHSNLAKVFGGEWTSRVIPCPESEQNVRRLALCDHYGIEVRQNLHIDMGGELEETEDLQKIPSRPCSRRQAPCGQCGRRVCVVSTPSPPPPNQGPVLHFPTNNILQRCRIDVATAQKLLGIDHFYCLDVTLRGTLTFACRLCEPANEDHLCSCGRNPLKGRYSRQNNVCFHCFDKDLQKAGLGTFSYFHQRHERGYFFDDDENTLQVISELFPFFLMELANDEIGRKLSRVR